MVTKRLLRRKKKLQESNELTSELSEKYCIPCEGGIPPLTADEIDKYIKGLKGWKVIDKKKLFKVFSFKGFRQAVEFFNKVATLSENEGHHPVTHVYYARLEIELYTFSIDGLSENDFILASKIDKI